ncbi:MAG: hypothetical protein AAGM38_02260 [Pseudomonadota bacterium]
MATSPPNTAIDRLDAPARQLGAPEAALFHNITQLGDRLITVGARGVIVISDDGGVSWRQAPSPVSVALTSVAARADGLAIAVGHDAAILRSEDAGDSWTRVADGRTLLPLVIEAAEARFKVAEQALAAASEAERGDLQFALEDEEFRLETAQTSMEYGPSWPLLDVLFASNAPDERRVLAIGGYGIAFLSEDAGETWSLISDRFDNVDDFHLNAGMVTDDGAVILGSEAGVLFRAEPDLASFEKIETFDGFSFFGLGYVETDAEKKLIAYGFGDTYHSSTDDGRSWESKRLSEAWTFVGDVRLPDGSLGVLGLGGVMVAIGSEGEIGRSRPLDARAPIGAALPAPASDRDIVFVGVDGARRVTLP